MSGFDSAPVWPRKLSPEQREILNRYTIVEKPGSVAYWYHEGIRDAEPWMDIDKLEMDVWGVLFNSNILPEYVGYGWLIGFCCSWSSGVRLRFPTPSTAREGTASGCSSASTTTRECRV